MDEISDAEGRYIANVVGVLRGDRPGEIFLISCEALEKTNHSTIAVTFDNALYLLWPEEMKNKNVLLITDAAPYIVKTGKGLQLLYPEMITVTCIAHALHRVAEEIRENNSDVDKLIATAKKNIYHSSNMNAEIQGNCPFCAFAATAHPHMLRNVA